MSVKIDAGSGKKEDRICLADRIEFERTLAYELSTVNVMLTERQLEQFYHFYQSLIQWNRVMNLTSITEWKEIITKHFVDSLSLMRAVPDIRDREYHIMDVGTGAGFPGIPLKIAYPHLELTLLDSLNKRVNFINQTTELLHLSRLKAIHGRAEDYGRDGHYREQFDLCVSRAVANLSTLVEYCLPFIHKGGCFISYKSGKVGEEVEAAIGAIKKLGGNLEDVINFTLPNADERALVVIRKTEETGKRYPRKAGLPAKEPLN